MLINLRLKKYVSSFGIRINKIFNAHKYVLLVMVIQLHLFNVTSFLKIVSNLENIFEIEHFKYYFVFALL